MKYSKRIKIGVDKDGHDIRKRFYGNTKKELETAIYEYKKEAESIKPTDVTFEEYSRKFLECKMIRETRTVEMYQCALNKCSNLDHLKVKDITISDLQLLINKHAEHPRACEQLRLTLRQIFEMAVDDLIIPRNIAKKLEIQKTVKSEKRSFTEAEQKALHKAKLKEQDKMYLELLLSTGLRPSEALALTVNDINYQDKTLNVSKSLCDGKLKDTKTHVNRTVPLSAALAKKLKAYTKVNKSLYLFTKQSGGLHNKTSYRCMFIRIQKAFNLALGGNDKMDLTDGFTLYRCRHTYATKLYYATQKGIISTKKAAEILGHSEIIFLKTYSHIDDSKEDIKKLMEVI